MPNYNTSVGCVVADVLSPDKNGVTIITQSKTTLKIKKVAGGIIKIMIENSEVIYIIERKAEKSEKEVFGQINEIWRFNNNNNRHYHFLAYRMNKKILRNIFPQYFFIRFTKA
ncbi:MAG: hypothetical protein N2Z58_05805 [Fervidobacterium sp.]|nr:hypothetical protein [Fervidobacterium sp.]